MANKQAYSFVHDESTTSSMIIWETIYMSLHNSKIIPLLLFSTEHAHWRQLMYNYAVFKIQKRDSISCMGKTIQFSSIFECNTILCDTVFDMQKIKVMIWRVTLDELKSIRYNCNTACIGFQILEDNILIDSISDMLIGQGSAQYAYASGSRGLLTDNNYYKAIGYGRDQWMFSEKQHLLKSGDYIDICVSVVLDNDPLLNIEFYVKGVLQTFEKDLSKISGRYILPVISTVDRDCMTVERIL
jgi:hypothetical protein